MKYLRFVEEYNDITHEPTEYIQTTFAPTSSNDIDIVYIFVPCIVFFCFCIIYNCYDDN